MTRRRSQRGSVSVELALGLPILVMVILAGVHFALVIKARSELGDATTNAARVAAIARNANPTTIRSVIQARLGTGSGCGNITVTSSMATDAFGVHRVDVSARCTVNTGISGLVSFLGTPEVAARASMPF
jgi:Flp pilus assembly protein TadG